MDVVEYWYAVVAINSAFPTKYYATLKTKTNALDEFNTVAEHCVQSEWALSLDQCTFAVHTEIDHAPFSEDGSVQKMRECISPEWSQSFRVYVRHPHDGLIFIEFSERYIHWPSHSARQLSFDTTQIESHPKIIWVIKSDTSGWDRHFARFSDALSTFENEVKEYGTEASTSHVDFSAYSNKKVSTSCTKGQWMDFLNEWKSDIEQTSWMDSDNYSDKIFFEVYDKRYRSYGRLLVAHFNMHPTSLRNQSQL